MTTIQEQNFNIEIKHLIDETYEKHKYLLILHFKDNTKITKRINKQEYLKIKNNQS